MKQAVAYYRTSSATNVGDEKHSHIRQQEATQAYATANNITIMSQYYDAAVKGADPITSRPGFHEMLVYTQANDIKCILIESASRFARDTVVQLTGYELLRSMGITLIPVDSPDHFMSDDPTARMIRTILSAVSEFEKDSLVMKLRLARAATRARTGRCEGRKPAPAQHADAARSYRASNPTASLRAISAHLASQGYLSPSSQPYSTSSIKVMLNDAL